MPQCARGHRAKSWESVLSFTAGAWTVFGWSGICSLLLGPALVFVLGGCFLFGLVW